jgi:hypothetical protein
LYVASHSAAARTQGLLPAAALLLPSRISRALLTTGAGRFALAATILTYSSIDGFLTLTASSSLHAALLTADLSALLHLRKSPRGLGSPKSLEASHRAAAAPAERPSSSYMCLLTSARAASATRCGALARSLTLPISAPIAASRISLPCRVSL